MSLDEQRTGFKVLRFRNFIEHNILEEVWFSGNHENISGQMVEGAKELSKGLSKIPFDWMVSKFEEYQVFPETMTIDSCEAKGLSCEEGKLWDDFFARHILWEKGRIFRRWPKDDALVHESVFCRKKVDLGENSHQEHEPKGIYTYENLKGQEYYNTDKKYSRTVKYDSVN